MSNRIGYIAAGATLAIGLLFLATGLIDARTFAGITIVSSSASGVTAVRNRWSPK